MDRRTKIERIISYYEVPAHDRTVSKIASRKPLDWFTDQQLEDIAREMVSADRRLQDMNRRNRAIYATRKIGAGHNG